jgi:hypothetical protein
MVEMALSLNLANCCRNLAHDVQLSILALASIVCEIYIIHTFMIWRTSCISDSHFSNCAVMSLCLKNSLILPISC